jgi:hypothetical protein
MARRRRRRRGSTRRKNPRPKKRSGGGVKMSLKLWAVLLVVAVAVGGYFLYAQWGGQHSTSTEGKPELLITPRVRDLGTVSVSGGTISTLFTIKNVGDGELVIRDMETSCMCTEAALIMDGEEGPKFGMRGHGARPVGWSARLAPGEQATLKVYYDPTIHPGLRGPVTRVVRIYSNDPGRPYADLAIELFQVD